MNTMGKILVFINFLFALLIIGFLAIDFARRTNWKAAFDNAEAQLRISTNNTTTLAESNRKYLETIGKLTSELNNFERKAKAREDELRQRFETEKASFAKSEMAGNLMGTRFADAVAENKRRAEEVATLQKVIKDRDEKIVKLTDEKEQLRITALNAEQDRANAQDRNNSLLAQVREQQKEIARLSNSPGAGGAVGRTSMKPPLTYVKGMVEKVLPDDKSLVQLSVGSDHGLEQGNTLLAYRLKPSPQFLGTVVVVDARHQKAVARFIPAETGSRRELQVGDEVASRLQR
jgi:hypothetical protein